MRGQPIVYDKQLKTLKNPCNFAYIARYDVPSMTKKKLRTKGIIWLQMIKCSRVQGEENIVKNILPFTTVLM